MAFNINDIQAALQYGGARQAFFQVTFDNPANRVATPKIPFLCRGTQLPSADLGTIQVPYFGRSIKLAGDRVYPPWQVTVINDEDYLIRHALEEWSNEINNFVGNIRTLADYKGEATVTQYAKVGGRPIRTYEFHGIYPSEISPVDMDWEATDQIMNFGVVFQYDYWTVSGETGTITGE